MTRALVAAALPMVRAGLAAVLRVEGHIEVVGEAADAATLLALAASLSPDVALIELETAADDMVPAMMQLTGSSTGIGVVLLCDANERWAQDAMRAGVRGVLSRDAAGAEIAAAVIAAGHGLMVLHPAAFQAMLPPPAPVSLIAEVREALTPREAQVLALLSEGLGNKVISRRLGISEHTVKFHVGAIMAKLGATSRTEAVTVAARRGLILL